MLRESSEAIRCFAAASLPPGSFEFKTERGRFSFFVSATAGGLTTLTGRGEATDCLLDFADIQIFPLSPRAPLLPDTSGGRCASLIPFVDETDGTIPRRFGAVSTPTALLHGGLSVNFGIGFGLSGKIRGDRSV